MGAEQGRQVTWEDPVPSVTDDSGVMEDNKKVYCMSSASDVKGVKQLGAK